MEIEKRRAKLATIIRKADTTDPDILAKFIMDNGFDYVLEIVARTVVTTMEKMKGN